MGKSHFSWKSLSIAVFWESVTDLRRKGQRENYKSQFFCTTGIVSDNPGLTMGYSASLLWQGVTVLWPCSLHSCHLYPGPWPHGCRGYKQRQIMWETLRSSDTQALTAAAPGYFVASSGAGMFESPTKVACPVSLTNSHN